MTSRSSYANAWLHEMAMPGHTGHRYFLNLKHLADIYGLAQITASFFPNPDDVLTGIYELLLNAIEHGNLAIGSDEKHALIRDGRWLEEVERRMALPEYASRNVDVEIIENADTVSVTIRDEGEGFDWQSQIRCNQRDCKPHGRGLWIAQQAGFDTIRFNERGNHVTCISYRPRAYGRNGH